MQTRRALVTGGRRFVSGAPWRSISAAGVRPSRPTNNGSADQGRPKSSPDLEAMAAAPPRFRRTFSTRRDAGSQAEGKSRPLAGGPLSFSSTTPRSEPRRTSPPRPGRAGPGRSARNLRAPFV